MMIRFIARLITVVMIMSASTEAFSQHGEQSDEHASSHADTHNSFQDEGAGNFIIHHIADANEIHLFGNVSVPLPIIIFVEGKGLDIFMSSAFHDVHGGHSHDGPTYARGPSTGSHYTKDELGITAKDESGLDLAIWDISITKSVFGMFFIILLMILMLKSVAKNYARRPGLAPKGIASLMEPLILFVRDGIAHPILGKEKSKKFMSFLLTTFFFIVACNLLGLIPFIGGFNITGTIGVTIVLAGLVFIITTINGNKHYWGHIVSPPGVPFFVKLLLVPIEIFGILLKPTVLMIRLTANISAGHIIILSFVSLIFIFGANSQAGGLGVGVFSTLFMIFMYFLELLVAFLQAYVFTLLAAIYFSEATQEPHH